MPIYEAYRGEVNGYTFTTVPEDVAKTSSSESPSSGDVDNCVNYVDPEGNWCDSAVKEANA